MSQLGLFGGAASSELGPHVTPEDRALAAALPPWLRLGTSSWSFPGWQGIVYDRKASPQELARHGLRAYAANPLHRAVGVDRSHYQPLSLAQWRGYADQVPEDFRFLVKAHEAATLLRFPDHPRYGQRRGQVNPAFMEPLQATEQVVGPTVEGLGSKLGVILFQVAPQDLASTGGPEKFCDRLYHFLSRLPRGVPYAVEVRDRRLLIPRLGQALEAAGVMPGLAIHPRLPRLRAQVDRGPARRAPLVVARWMLRPDMEYQQARQRFHPFTELAAPDPGSRQELVDLLIELSRESVVIINNKAEGSSPLSLRALARALAVPRGTTNLP